MHMRLLPKQNLEADTQQYLHPNKMLADRGFLEFSVYSFLNAVRSWGFACLVGLVFGGGGFVCF